MGSLWSSPAFRPLFPPSFQLPPCSPCSYSSWPLEGATALDANPDRCADTGSSLNNEIRAGRSWAIRRKGVQDLTSVTVSPDLSLSLLEGLQCLTCFFGDLPFVTFSQLVQQRTIRIGPRTRFSNSMFIRITWTISLKCSFPGPYPQNVDFIGRRWGPWISILKQAPEVILIQVFWGHCFEKQWPGRRSNLGPRWKDLRLNRLPESLGCRPQMIAVLALFCAVVVFLLRALTQCHQSPLRSTAYHSSWLENCLQLLLFSPLPESLLLLFYLGSITVSKWKHAGECSVESSKNQLKPSSMAQKHQVKKLKNCFNVEKGKFDTNQGAITKHMKTCFKWLYKYNSDTGWKLETKYFGSFCRIF